MVSATSGEERMTIELPNQEWTPEDDIKYAAELFKDAAAINIMGSLYSGGPGRNAEVSASAAWEAAEALWNEKIKREKK